MVTALSPAEVDATAALASQDTAPPVVETQPVTTETVTPAAGTETARTTEATETPDPLAELDEEVVKASPKHRAIVEAEVKAAEAKQAESYRQRSEAAQKATEERVAAEAYTRQQQELDEVERGSISNALAQVVDRVAYSDPEARQRLQAEMPELQRMAETLSRTTGMRLDRRNVDTLNAYLADKFPEFRIAPEKVAAFDTALAKGDFTARRQIEYDLIGEAALAKERTAMRAEILKEVNAEAAKSLANERTKAAEAAATNRGGPTAVAGRPAAVGNYRSLHEVEEAHARGELTNAQVRVYRAMPRDQMPQN